MFTETKNPIELITEWSVCPYGFYADDRVYRNKTPQNLISNPLFKIIANRVMLREFCQQNDIVMPDFIFSNKFESLAAWAVKRNIFPMIIKSAENRSESESCFILKAFRELPEFFEKINLTQPEGMILEEFIQTKNRIEVTIINNRIRLISQIGLEMSMVPRHLWRIYPLELPGVVNKQLISIIEKFLDLTKIPDILFRFSFSFYKGRLILISLNAGMNRLEYHPHWSKAAGITNLFESPETKKNFQICKLMVYFDIGEKDYSVEEFKVLIGNTAHKIASTPSRTFVMLSETNMPVLLEKSKKIDTFFKHKKTYKPIGSVTIDE